MLRMNLLGPVSLTLTEPPAPLRFRSQTEVGLLVYLAQTGAPQGRDLLADLLWEARTTKQVLGNLRTTLTRLRPQVGDSLIVRRDTLAYDPDARQQVDSVCFETRMQDLGPVRSAEDARQLAAALSLYTGDFLAGFSLPHAPRFSEWGATEQVRLRTRMLAGYRRLVAFALEREDLALALDSAERWLKHDRLNEDAYRGLMQAHFLAGDPSAALHVYHTCLTLLAAELGEAPMPETTVLAETIRRSAPAPWPPPRQEAPVSLDSSPFILPMVGRAAEVARLAATFNRVTGNPQCPTNGIEAVLVAGESGVGKTRLVTEFLEWAARQGADILRGRAYEAGGGLPYQSLIMALRERLERENAPEDLVADVWLAEISRLLPELQERYPDLEGALVPYGSNETIARSRLFEAVARLGEAMSRRRPLVLFLDDWHWADEGSLDLLYYLGQSWAQSKAPVLVVLTLRSENLGTDARLTEWLVTWERRLPGVYQWLTRLTGEDVLSFVAAWTGVDRESAAVRTLSGRLFAETAGNPFFLVETVNLLAEQMGALPGEVDPLEVLVRIETGVALPPTVRKAVLSRLAKQGQTATDLLAAAAVLGRRCRFEEMCQISGVDELAGLPALDALLDGQLLIDTGDSRTPYAFAHDKIRDVVYTEAGHSRRRIFHQRAVVALEPAAPAAELAYHAEQARLTDKARHYLQLAGDVARDLYENGLAVDFYGRALALTPADDAEARYDLVVRLQDVHHLQGNRKAQASDLADLERLALQLDDAGRQAATWLRQARYAEVTGDHPAAAAAAQEVVRMAAESAESDVLVQGYLAWGAALSRLGAYEQSQIQLKQALEHARAADLPAWEADALRNLGIGAAYRGDLGLARNYFEKSLILFRQTGKLQSEAAALGNLGVLSLMVGDYAGSQDYLVQSQVMFARMGDRRGELLGLSNLGSIAHEQGNLVQAAEYYLKAIALAQEIGDRLSECEALNLLGYLRLDESRTGVAHDRFAAGLAIARELKLVDYVIECLAGLAGVALAEHHLVEARDLVAAYIDDLGRTSIAQVAEPYRVYLTSYHVFQVNEDSRAPAILGDAYRLLQEQANKISDDATRWSFLNNIPAHREVVMEFEHSQVALVGR